MMLRWFLAASLLLAACGGGQKVKDKPMGDPADLDGPTAEELAQSPCGNPDWSKLPPGSDEPASEEAPQQ